MRTRFSAKRRTFFRTLSVPLIVLGASILATCPADGAWRVAPAIGVGLEFDDNANLVTESVLDSSVNGYLVEANVDFIYDSQLTDFSLSPRVRVSRYDDLTELDSEDLFLDLDYDYTGERSRFRLLGTYGDESARTAERSDVDFGVEDPEDFSDDDSGRTLNAENRQRLQIRPQWSYQTSRKSQIRIGGRYLDVSYDDRTLQLNTDYTEALGSVGLDYAWSERNTFTIDGHYRKSDFDRLGRDYSGYGATIGFNRSLNEQTRLIMNIGADSTEDFEGNKQTSPIGAISLVRNMETSRVVASYRRSVTASGAGVVSVRDSVNLNYTRDLGEKLSIGLGANAYQTDPVGENVVSFDERDYLQLRVLLNWNLTREFAVDLEYSYTDIDRESFAGSVDSSRLNLWFRYQRAVR